MKRDQSGVSGVSWHMVYSFGAGALSAQVGVWRAIWGCCGDVTGCPGVGWGQEHLLESCLAGIAGAKDL
jgi:hypothetical protein